MTDDSVPRDRVAEYIDRMNAEAAARPNPLLTSAEQAARAAAGPPPAKTGDTVVDYLARERWLATCRPNPLARP